MAEVKNGIRFKHKPRRERILGTSSVSSSVNPPPQLETLFWRKNNLELVRESSRARGAAAVQQQQKFLSSL